MSKTKELFEPGDVIGGLYTIVRTLGKGGFGIVYHVRSDKDGRDYALKTYLKGSGDRKAIARFRQESEIWIALGAHPYLVQAFFIDEIEGRLYVGMEMILPGQSGHNDLDGFIKHSRPDLRQILVWAVQICFGMEYAASRGIRSHRDIKPANVMINERGEVKINDFGLVTQPGATDDDPSLSETELAVAVFRGQTMRGIGFGTPTYMPPEQFEDAAACDARSDIYAVGVMLYQLITGELPVTVPWPTDSSLETRLKFWKDMEAAHRAFTLPSLDSPLLPLLSKCITPDPQDRYQDFAAFRIDLSGLLLQVAGLRIEEPVVEAMKPGDWITRGNSFLRLQRFNEGLHSFRKAISLSSRSSEAWLGQGICLRGLGSATNAIESLDVVLKLKPNEPSALAYRAGCLHDLGQFQEAVRWYDVALSITSEIADTWVGRGRLLSELGDQHGAMESYNRALSLNARHVEALTEKAVIMADSEDYNGALHLFETALEINDGYARASRGRAACLVYLGEARRGEQAISALERSAEMSSEMFIARAISLTDLEQSTRALASLDQVTDPSMKNAASVVLTRVLVGLNRFEEALKVVERFTGTPNVPFELRIQLMILLHVCGRHSEALTLIGPLLEERPGDESTCLVACCAGIKSGRDEEALQACTYGLSSAPESAKLMYNKGVVLSVMDRSDESADAFETAVRLQPQWNDAWYNLGFASLFSGRADRGMECLHYALSAGNPPGNPIDARNSVYIRDEIRMLRPESLMSTVSNGWSPRYRVPHLRPPIMLFPTFNPPRLAH